MKSSGHLTSENQPDLEGKAPLADGLGKAILTVVMCPHGLVDKLSLGPSLSSLLVPFTHVLAAGGIEEGSTLAALTGLEDMSLGGVLTAQL